METEYNETISIDNESGIGYVVGESSTSQVIARYDDDVMRGEYVIVGGPQSLEDCTNSHASGDCVLGLVEDVIARDDLIEEGLRTEDIRKLVEDIGLYEPALYAKIRLLGSIKSDGKRIQIRPPRRAPLPGTPVRRAPNSILSKIFSRKDDNYIRIGVLAAHPQVEFRVDLNQIVTRHLAILAVTGAGKSNTVTVLANSIINKKGIIVIFDMHGEYVDAFPKEYVNKIVPKIDPNKLDYTSLARLLNLKDAPKQELYIRNLVRAWDVLYRGGYYKDRGKMLDAISEMIEYLINSRPAKLPIIKDKDIAFRTIKEEMSKSSNIINNPLVFLENIMRKLRSGNYATCHGKEDRCKNAMNVLEVPPSDRNNTLPSLLIKLEDMKERYSNIIDFYAKDIVEQLEKGKVNVVDLSSVDEDGADVIVSTFLKKILQERKRYVQTQGYEGFKYPIMVVIEEAHILAPKDRTTSTKYWTSRIAREGRKFGVGLCLVSQRPKGLDQDTLSQANNMIILRLVEPTDQKHVQASSEALSDDLLKQLPSLATGEAIVIGPMTPLPALVRIDKATQKRVGTDINVVDEWGKEDENRDDDLW